MLYRLTWPNRKSFLRNKVGYENPGELKVTDEGKRVLDRMRLKWTIKGKRDGRQDRVVVGEWSD